MGVEGQVGLEERPCGLESLGESQLEVGTRSWDLQAALDSAPREGWVRCLLCPPLSRLLEAPGWHPGAVLPRAVLLPPAPSCSPSASL